MPVRPREIKLDDVDPCTLILEADYPDYYMDEDGVPGEDERGNAECGWDGTEVGYFGIILDVSDGIETRLDGTYTVVGEVTDPVLNFGAVTYALRGKSTTPVSSPWMLPMASSSLS